MKRRYGMAAVGDLQPFRFLDVLIFGMLQHLYGDIRIQAAGHIGSFKLKNIIVGIADALDKIHRFPVSMPKMEAMLAGAFWSMKVGTSVRTGMPWFCITSEKPWTVLGLRVTEGWRTKVPTPATRVRRPWATRLSVAFRTVTRDT